MARRRAWWIGLGVILVVLLAFGTWRLLQEIPGLMAKAEDTIRKEAESLGLEVSFRNLHFHPLHLRVSLDDLDIRDRIAGQPLARAKHVDVSLSPRRLLAGRLPVSRVLVRMFSVSGGEANRRLLEKLRASGKGEERSAIPEVILIDGEVRIGPLGPLVRWDAKIPELRIRPTRFRGTRITVRVRRSAGQVDLPGAGRGNVPFDSADAKVILKGNSVRISSLRASGSSAKIVLSGKWEGEPRTVDVEFSGETDVAGWAANGAPGGGWLRGVLSEGNIAISGRMKGPLEGPEGSGKILARNLLLRGGTPASADLSLAVSGGKIRLQSIGGKIWDGILSGDGAYDFRTGNGDANLRLRQAAFGKAPWESWGISWRPAGRGNLAVSLTGGRERIRGIVSLQNPGGMERPAADGVPAARVDLAIQADADCDWMPAKAIRIRQFRINAGKAEVTGAGEHGFADGTLSFSGKFLVPAAKVAEYGFLAPLSWNHLSGEWTVSGTEDNPHVTAGIRAEDLAAGMLPPVPLSVKLDGEMADVIHFVADIPADLAKVTATGTLAGPLSARPLILAATVLARNIDFSQAATWGSALLSSLGKDPAQVRRYATGMSGTGNADLECTVAARSYSFAGTISSEEIRFPGIRVRSASASGSFGEWPSGPRWDFRADGRFGEEGEIRLEGKGEGEKAGIKGKMKDVDLGTAVSLLQPEGGGRVEGRVTLEAEVRKEKKGWENGMLSASAPRISVGGVTIEGVSAEGSFDASAGRFSLVSASPRVRASAAVRREKGWPVSFSVNAEGVPTGTILQAVGREEPTAGGTWDGEAAGTVQGEDILGGKAIRADALSEFRFSLSAASPSFSGFSFDAVYAEGEKEKDVLAGRIGSRLPDTRLSFSLSLREPFGFQVEGPFAVGKPAEPAVSGDKPAPPREAPLSNGKEKAPFRIAGKVRIGGSLLALQNSRGTFQVERMQYRNGGIDLRGEDITIVFSSEGIRWEKGALETAGNPLQVSGKASWAGILDLRLKGAVPAQAVRLATDIFDRLEGTVHMELRVTGKWDDPSVIGTGHLKDGTFSFRQYAQLFEGMSAEAVISREKIIFEYFEGRSGGGYLDGRGELPLRFAEGQKMFFSVDFFDMRYPYPEDLRPVLQGHVEVIGPVKDLLITGDVEVQSARYTKTVRPEDALLDFRKRLADVTARRRESDFRIRLDLEAIADETIRIQNNLAEADIKGEFKVAGDTGRIIVLGSFDVTEGHVEYRGNRYSLVRGTLEFQDPRRNNPRLDFRGETKKGSVTVAVAVTGTLEKYEVEFFSDPPLSKNDIVSLLSLGVTAENLAQASGSVSAAEAAAIALGPYKGRVEEEIRTVIGLDKFAIEPSFSSTDRSPEPRFIVGKTFGERFSVSVSTNVGATTESSALAEYKLLENVYLQGAWQSATTTREGDLGGDVKFRYRYRQFRDIFRGRD